MEMQEKITGCGLLMQYNPALSLLLFLVITKQWYRLSEFLSPLFVFWHKFLPWHNLLAVDIITLLPNGNTFFSLRLIYTFCRTTIVPRQLQSYHELTSVHAICICIMKDYISSSFIRRSVRTVRMHNEYTLVGGFCVSSFLDCSAAWLQWVHSVYFTLT